MNTIHFDGPCPFLTCLKTDPHDHAVCEECGSVRYGNLHCATCAAHAEDRRREFAETIEILRRAETMEPIR